MSGKRSRIEQDLNDFIQAIWLELPAALVQRMSGGRDGDEAARKAGWKAYDAWIGLANEAANRLYENRTFAVLSGRAMESALRAQEFGRTAAGAFFSNLWPAVGLPTSNEMAALRNEVVELREQLAEKTAGQQQPSIHVKAHEDGLYLVRGHSQALRIAEDKEDAAA